MELINYIECLLRDNDCVIVPGFGAFICQNFASSICDGVLLPPSRSVVFNAALTHNDGLVANAFMKQTGCGYNAAVAKVEGDVKTIKESLVANHSFDFGKIGSFHYSDAGCVVFAPSAVGLSGVNLSNYGLQPVRIQNVVKSEEKAPRRRFSEIRMNALRMAVSVAAIIVLVLTLTTPIAIDSLPDKASVASISAAQPKAKGKRVNVVEKMTKRAVKIESNDIEAVEKGVGGETGKKYSVVIASLKSYGQAKKFVETSSETGLVIIDAAKGSSVYKVALATGDTKEEMYSYIQKNGITEKYPDVWVCRN